MQDHIVNVLRPAYVFRYRVLLRAIRSHLFPLGFTLPQPNRKVSGRYFLWVSLPPKLNAEELTAKCQRDENLAIAPGNLFKIPADDVTIFDGHVRLCFAWEPEWKLAEGVRRIGVSAKRACLGSTARMMLWGKSWRAVACSGSPDMSSSLGVREQSQCSPWTRRHSIAE